MTRGSIKQYVVPPEETGRESDSDSDSEATVIYDLPPQYTHQPSPNPTSQSGSEEMEHHTKPTIPDCQTMTGDEMDCDEN